MVKPCNVVSGLLKNFGRAIAHSIVIDNTGFPFLSPPMYYYLLGMEDIAITYLLDIDVSGQECHAISKVHLFFILH